MAHTRNNTRARRLKVSTNVLKAQRARKESGKQRTEERAEEVKRADQGDINAAVEQIIEGQQAEEDACL